MKFTDCHSSVAFFMYCSAAVLVIVNGQPTIDDDIDKDQISILIDIVGKMEHKIAKLEGQLASTSTTKPDASKLNRMTLHLPDCVTFLLSFFYLQINVFLGFVKIYQIYRYKTCSKTLKC